jgi:hypothetical protein
MNSSLRWLLVLPASLLAWAAVVLVGTFTHGYAETALCPPDDLVSGFCDNAKVRAKINLLLLAFVALSAIAVVAAAVATAPSRKVAVAWMSVAVGAFIAFLVAGFSTEWLSAVIAGTVAAAATTAYRRRPNPSINTDAAR